MHTLHLAAPAEAGAHRPTGDSEASGEASATGFLAILSAVRRPGGESVPDGNGRPVRLLTGGQPGGEAEAKTTGQWAGGSALRTALLQPVDVDGAGGQGAQKAVSGENGAAKGKANGKGTSASAAKVNMVPLRPGGESSGGTSSGTKQASLVGDTFSTGDEGRVRQGRGRPESTKGKASKQMPKTSSAGGTPQKGQAAGPALVREGTLVEGETARPDSRVKGGKTRSGPTPGAQSSSGAPKGDGALRGDAGRSQGKASATGGHAGTDEKNGHKASLLATKKSAADPGRRSESAREALSRDRSSHGGRGRRASGPQAQGRAGQHGGGHQKGGQSGQGGGQNGPGQKGAGPNGQGTKARNPASPPSFSLSSSSASSSESDANALRASLTREASTTGSGVQGTDGKGAGASGPTSGAAGAKSTGRPGGGAGPPRTMPSAWLNAAKQGTLRTAELAGGWKAMEMSLGEDKGTMTVKARKGSEHTAVSVGFSEARVQAQVVANARQLQDAMQAQYGTDVDLSFGGGDASDSDQQTTEGGASDRSSTLAPGGADTNEDGGGASPLRSRGRREWVG